MPQKKFIPVMLTPFKEDSSIDFDLLFELTEFYIAAGADGLFTNCLSSEMFELTNDERIAIAKRVVDIVKGRIPVVATGTFGGPLNREIDFIKKIHDTGIQSVILITGILADEHEPDYVLENAFNEILKKTTQISFGFYECPVPYKRIVSADLLKKFVETERVNYFKDTSLDIDMVKQKIQVGQGHDFGLYDAYMVHAVESLKAGAAGLSCIQGNYFPELIVWLCKNYNNPLLIDEANAAQQFLTDNMNVMHFGYPTAAKIFLKIRGLDISSFSRRRVETISTTHEKDLQLLYQDYTALAHDLSISGIVLR